MQKGVSCGRVNRSGSLKANISDENADICWIYRNGRWWERQGRKEGRGEERMILLLFQHRKRFK